MTVPPTIYIPAALPTPDELFLRLRDDLTWVRRDQTPRLEYYVNSANTPYTYGKGAFARTYAPGPSHSAIQLIQAIAEKQLNIEYQVCFLNRYLHARDHLGWHSDNSPEMDDTKPIVIASLGAEREIWFRPIGSTDDVTKLMLGHGSICIMGAGMQDVWQHRIPKSGRECGERISLTFRGYVS